MNATLLLQWLVGALGGSMLFFAIVVAPTSFRALPADMSGVFLRRLFPLYYLWGLVISLLSTSTAFFADDGISGTVCTIVALLFVYVRVGLLPQLERLRQARQDGDPAATRRFRRLHLQSVLINFTQLALLIGISLYPNPS
jgi:hypothetical protein